MAQKLLFADDTIAISYDYLNQWIYVDWRGEQNHQTVKEGCERMLEYLKSELCHKVLNDNTNVRGSWSDASEWVALDWFPRMANAGLKYFAWVYSPSTFSQLSTNKTLNLNKSVIAVTFQNIDTARKWLQSM